MKIIMMIMIDNNDKIKYDNNKSNNNKTEIEKID